MQLQSFRMANRESMKGFIFNNKASHKRTANKVVCLNPLCNEQRMFEVEEGTGQGQYQDHLSCKGWVCDLDQMAKRFQESLEGCIESEVQFDYIEEPIEAIMKSESLDQIRWEDSLFKCFDTIQKSVETQLTRIYIKCQREISHHIDQSKELSSKIRAFCEQIANGWEQSHLFIYNEYLKNDLMEVQKKGKISMSNIGMLERRFEVILNEVKKFQHCIWNFEPSYDILNRLEMKSKRCQLVGSYKLQPNQANQKIHEMQSLLKGKVKFFEGRQMIQAYCFRCSSTFQASEGKNIKSRKQQCKKLILNHLCTGHTQQILAKMNKMVPIKLTLPQLIKEIEIKKIRNVVVIDKENIVVNSNFLSSYEDLYCVEILSKNSENIAKGRHLIAESKGKDAADILIVLVLYELGKLNLNEITLLTNDHYGETMQPIFSSLGIGITIKNKEDISIEEY